MLGLASVALGVLMTAALAPSSSSRSRRRDSASSGFSVESLRASMTTLGERLMRLSYPEEVSYIYNPLAYAQQPFSAYVTRYAKATQEVLLLGMNPGPFGMAQTGIPFGEVSYVRDWLGICAPVGRPPKEHPKRPILGFSCTRSEVSGRRLWGWAQATFGTPELFAERFFVYNYCPLVFMEASGRNLTPDKLPRALRLQIYRECDAVLVEVARTLGVTTLVGIGGFARARAEAATQGSPYKIVQVLHPSPASPMANRGWAKIASEQLRAAGIALPILEAPRTRSEMV